jgi:hypothetical protein
MSVKIDKNKKIILDADVIISFIKGGRLGTLVKIFPNKYCLLDYVFNEVFKGQLRVQVENLIKFGLVEEIKFEEDIRIVKEFARLKRTFGPGESACMAYCKFNKDVIGSSNLKDIKRYCEDNEIQYLTTLDFLLKAYNKGIMTEAECDEFIYTIKLKGDWIPVDTIQEYISKQS